MRKLLKTFVRDERGVSAMEYAVLAGIVVLALGGMGVSYKANILLLFNGLYTQVTTAQSGTSGS